MLKSLSIKNYAIIDRLELQPSEGLNVLTGETGAGKSILLGALGLVLGQRADLGVLRNPEEKCVVEAIFQLADGKLKPILEENDLDFSTEMILRREILPAGKSRAFVNDTPARLSLLQQISSLLVDLHQQFSSLDIYQQNYQLGLVDAMGDNEKSLRDYREIFNTWQSKKRELEKLKLREAEATKEHDFVAFQCEELQEFGLQKGEKEELEERLHTLENFEGIKHALSKVESVIENSPASMESQLNELLREMRAFSEMNQEIKSLAERLESAAVELSDISREASLLNEQMEHNPGEAETTRQRLDELIRLMNKHQVESEEDLIVLQADLEEKLKSFDSVSEEISALEEELADCRKQLQTSADKLSDNRKKAAGKMEKETMKILQTLSMPHARLKISLTPSGEPRADGMDEVEFLFSANKGVDFKNLRDVASGGEISRLNLAIKSIIAGRVHLPTLIFDEIDSGVSGDVALKMGRILKKTASEHQVIVITHSPQVAACGSNHFFIYKKSDTKHTQTHLKQLNGEDRLHHIAVMLSSDPPGQAALQNARELLETNN